MKGEGALGVEQHPCQIRANPGQRRRRSGEAAVWVAASLAAPAAATAVRAVVAPVFCAEQVSTACARAGILDAAS